MEQIRFDWPAYFKLFSDSHGGNPVPFEGRQLFYDGWMYSASDYAGPEYPPPTDPDELYRLQRAYWLIRRRLMKKELRERERQYAFLVDFQQNKSVPLQKSVIVVDDGQRVRKTADVDIGLLGDEITWLQEAITECTNNLEELNHAPTTNE